MQTNLATIPSAEFPVWYGGLHPTYIRWNLQTLHTSFRKL